MAQSTPTALFLSSQTALLSRPLPTPSQTPAHDEIPLKAVNAALQKLNRQIKQYSATVYSLSAQRHVEAQLDALYTELVSSGANPLKGEIVLPKGFKEDGIGIEDLPEGEDLGDESIQEEYDALREKLLRLKKTVGEVRKKREALRFLRERLEVLQGSSEGVQKELVGVRSGWDEEMKETRAKVLEVRRWVADVEDEGAREDDVKRDIRDVALDLVK